MSDTTEPAVPLLRPIDAGAMVPKQAIDDLFALAAMKVGSLERTGVRVHASIGENGTRLAAVVTIKHVAAGTLDAGFVTVKARGRWVGGAIVQWTLDDD